jgi:D-alanyl-D-alanine carboxypeptidase/D-alanyl-D-alanine-endopeptidase (penicillin-binding protein 4)
VAGRGSFSHLGPDGAAQRPPGGGRRPGDPESDQTVRLPERHPVPLPVEDTVRLPLASLSQALPAVPPSAQPPPPPPLPPPLPPPPPARRPKRRRALLTGVLALVVALLLALATVVAVRPGPVDGWLGGEREDPVLDPLPSDPPPAPVLAGASTDGPMPTPDGVSGAIGPLVTASGLGSRVNVSVVDVATGQRLYGRGQDTLTLPASTNKLVTGTAVLAARGPTYRIPTQAVAGGRPGEVVLVGGGDPTLAAGATGSYPGAARLDQLAAQVKQALGGAAPTKVTVDSSLFTGPVYGPWEAGIARNGYAGPAVALMTDGARVNPKRIESPSARHEQPDLAAGLAFAKALGLPASAVSRGAAPDGGRQLGQVESMPIGRMVEIMLSESDNVIAEMLARQVAVAKGQPASYAGAAAAMKAVLTDLGLPAAEIQLSDGSGFSRADRLSPSVLTDLLRIAADPAHPELRGIFSGLPVAGWSGTLQDRYRAAAAGSQAGAGLVRAKTGTLRGVNAIAGVVVDADGRLLAFALMADAVPIGQEPAQNALDRIAAKLATCGCR